MQRTLAERRWLRLGMLCAFYVAQGIPWGFTAVTIPAYLTAHGVDAAAIAGVLGATTLPYAFKWVWGPIIDSFQIPRWGRRRPWILFAQLMMALTILAMALVPDLSSSVRTLTIVVMVHTVFNALQDVAVDALAVDLLADDERGRANGFMYASKYLGGIAGGAGLSWLITKVGMRPALIGQTLALLAVMIVPAITRETARPVEERPRLRDVARGLVEAFSVRSAFIAGLLMLTVNTALGILTANGFALFQGQLGWSEEKLASLTGGLGLGMGLSGAIVGGLIADFVGRKRLAVIASLGLAAGWLAFGLLTNLWTNDWFIYLLSCFEGFTAAMLTVTLFAICMDVSWAKIGATQFAAYMAFANFSTTVGFKLAERLDRLLEFDGVYLVAAGLQILVTCWLLAIDPKQTARSLPRADDSRLPASGIAGVSVFGAILAVMTYYALAG